MHLLRIYDFYGLVLRLLILPRDTHLKSIKKKWKKDMNCKYFSSFVTRLLAFFTIFEKKSNILTNSTSRFAGITFIRYSQWHHFVQYLNITFICSTTVKINKLHETTKEDNQISPKTIKLVRRRNDLCLSKDINVLKEKKCNHNHVNMLLLFNKIFILHTYKVFTRTASPQRHERVVPTHQRQCETALIKYQCSRYILLDQTPSHLRQKYRI